MLKPISTEVEKLMFLRDVVIPYVKEREKEGKVDLNRIWHPCGSPSCLAGWAVYMFGNQLGVSQSGPLPDTIRALHKVLGTNGSDGLFTMRDSLDDRARAIDRIIERKIMEAQCAK